MPANDIRGDGALFATSGRKNVIYIDAKGRSRNALVRGDGTSSGLKLWVPSLHSEIDNVPAGSESGSSCYVSR